MCVCHTCTLGLCHKVSKKSIHSTSHEGVETNFCKRVQRFWSYTSRVRWGGRLCAFTRQLSTKNICLETCELSKGGVISSAQKQRVSLYSKGALGKKSLVSQLFCRILWWRSHFYYSTIYWKSAITNSIVGVIHLGRERPSFLTSGGIKFPNIERVSTNSTKPEFVDTLWHFTLRNLIDTEKGL